MNNPTPTTWRKSTHSGNGNNCIEVALNQAHTHGVVLIRDSKDPNGPTLAIGTSSWSTFVNGASDVRQI